MEAQQPDAVIDKYTNMLFDYHVQEVIPQILEHIQLLETIAASKQEAKIQKYKGSIEKNGISNPFSKLEEEITKSKLKHKDSETQ